MHVEHYTGSKLVPVTVAATRQPMMHESDPGFHLGLQPTFETCCICLETEDIVDATIRPQQKILDRAGQPCRAAAVAAILPAAGSTKQPKRVLSASTFATGVSAACVQFDTCCCSASYIAEGQC